MKKGKGYMPERNDVIMKKRIKMRAIPFMLTIFLLAMMIVPIMPTMVMAAEVPVELGSAASFAILAGTTITNTGSTVVGGEVGGNIGVSTGSAITGFPPGIITMEQHTLITLLLLRLRPI